MIGGEDFVENGDGDGVLCDVVSGGDDYVGGWGGDFDLYKSGDGEEEGG